MIIIYRTPIVELGVDQFIRSFEDGHVEVVTDRRTGGGQRHHILRHSILANFLFENLGERQKHLGIIRHRWDIDILSLSLSHTHTFNSPSPNTGLVEDTILGRFWVEWNQQHVKLFFGETETKGGTVVPIHSIESASRIAPTRYAW